jgi:integrase
LRPIRRGSECGRPSSGKCPTPHFSPHGLRKRRGSLLSKQGYSLAEVAERLGDTKVIAAEHYLYALGDYTEVEYGTVLDP